MRKIASNHCPINCERDVHRYRKQSPARLSSGRDPRWRRERPTHLAPRVRSRSLGSGAGGSFADVIAKRDKLRPGRCDLRHPKLDAPSAGGDARYIIVATIKAAKRANLNVNVRANAFARIVLHNTAHAAAKYLRPGRRPGGRRLQGGRSQILKNSATACSYATTALPLPMWQTLSPFGSASVGSWRLQLH